MERKYPESRYNPKLLKMLKDLFDENGSCTMCMKLSDGKIKYFKIFSN